MGEESVYPELELTSGSEHYDGRIEIWPELECPACGADNGRVRWESGTPESEASDSVPSYEVYDGKKPCCRRCGVNVAKLEETERPAEWKQPLLFVAVSVSGLSPTHPAVNSLAERFSNDPFGFLTASVDELQSVRGIGEKFARGIMAARSVTYPDVAPEPDFPVYPFRAKAVSDTDPDELLHDVSVHGYGSYDEITVPDGHEESKKLLEEAAQEARRRAERDRERGFVSEDKIKENEQLAAELESKAAAVACS